jgi:hypothetical protein
MDNTTQIKSANQLYRESGSTLPFKQWIEREKEKGIFIPNIEAQNEMMNVIGSGSEGSDKPNHLVRNIAVLAIIGVLGYFVYRTIKNKTNE